MANPHRGQYRIEVDGKAYTLELKADAICSIESELNLSMGGIQQRLIDPNTSTMSIVKVVFNAALVPRDDTVFGKLWPDEVLAHVSKALALAYGAESETPESKPNPTAPGAAQSTDGIGPGSMPDGSGSASTRTHSGTKHPAKSAA